MDKENSWKEEIIQNKLGGKREWSDTERLELCLQLDKEMNKSLDSISGENKILEGRWTEENWKEKMAEHPIFSPYLQEDGETQAPINELSEGLAQLKYDLEHNTPLEVAQNYKEEGVHYFKYKKYRFSIASFTAGIKANCSDNELNAQLYNNRGAANYHLENYKSSLMDCCKAIELKPEYVKAIKRGIDCANKMKAWDKMVELCDQCLLLEPADDELRRKRKFATTEKEKQVVELRKKGATLRKQLKQNKRLLDEIASRGIEILSSSSTLELDEEDPSTIVHNLKPHLQSFTNSFVHLNNETELVWPVLFKYPEHSETDTILEFNENSRFIDHLEEMFGPDLQPTPWDVELKYKPENILIYYSMYSKRRLVPIDPTSTLKKISTKRKFEVKDGTPTFLIFVKGSKFVEEYLRNFNFGME